MTAIINNLPIDEFRDGVFEASARFRGALAGITKVPPPHGFRDDAEAFAVAQSAMVESCLPILPSVSCAVRFLGGGARSRLDGHVFQLAVIGQAHHEASRGR